MDSFLEADLDSLSEVEGVGSVRAELILTEVAELQEVIERLLALGVGVAEPVTDSPAEGPFTGKRVCVTGSIANMNREEAQAFATSAESPKEYWARSIKSLKGVLRTP
jgi:NAD-dependent DNA ligase